jgi:hypothetical protein
MLLKIEWRTKTEYLEPDFVRFLSDDKVEWGFPDYEGLGDVQLGSVTRAEYNHVTLWSDSGVELEELHGDPPGTHFVKVSS